MLLLLFTKEIEFLGSRLERADILYVFQLVSTSRETLPGLSAYSRRQYINERLRKVGIQLEMLADKDKDREEFETIIGVVEQQ